MERRVSVSELWSTTFHRNRGEKELFVLFLCVENANRSQMAERFARSFGGEKIKSFSAGSASAMKEAGLDMEGVRPKSAGGIPDVEYDLVVTMGCGDFCPHVRSKRVENWDIPDPADMDEKGVREVRDLIKSKVKTALETLSGAK